MQIEYALNLKQYQSFKQTAKIKLNIWYVHVFCLKK